MTKTTSAPHHSGTPADRPERFVRDGYAEGRARSPMIRASGVAAMLGGGLWMVGTVLHALEPRGCVGAECATRPMRDSSALVAVLAVGAVVLIMVGVAGLVRLARDSGRLGRSGRLGVRVGVAWLVALLTVGMVQLVLFGGDFRLMPYFVLPGMSAVVVGFLLVGIAIMRAGVLPRWAGVLLVLGSLALVGANEQTELVLLMLPFGLAWAAAGYAMTRRN